MNFLSFYLLLLLIIRLDSYELNLKPSKNYKIFLACFSGSRSHVKGLLTVGKELDKRGHEFKLIATPKRVNWITRDHYNFSGYSVGVDEEMPLFDRLKKYEKEQAGFNSDAFLAHDIENMIIKPYDLIFQELVDIIDKENPDLIICDFVSTVCIDVAGIRKVPMIIGFQSVDFGSVLETSYISITTGYDLLHVGEMDIFSRFYHFIYTPLLKIYYYFPIFKKFKEVKEKYNVPYSAETITGNYKNALIWINSFWGFELPRYTPPNIQMIGPILDKEGEIGEQRREVNDFMKNKKNVVYIAFGTNLRLDKPIFDIILAQLIKSLKDKVIDGAVWSLTNTKPELPETILINKEAIQVKEYIGKQLLLIDYVNQPLLLNQTNIKLFITHAGLESIFESILAYTPMLNLPFYFDQPRNARKTEILNISKTILKDKLISQPELISQYIDMILNNYDYYLNNLKIMNQLILANRFSTDSLADKLIHHIQTAKLCRGMDKKELGYFDSPCELNSYMPVTYFVEDYKVYHYDIKLAMLGLILVPIYFIYKRITRIKLKVE